MKIIHDENKTEYPLTRGIIEEFPSIGHARAFLKILTRSDACKAAFPTEESQIEILREIKEDILKEDIVKAKKNHEPIPKSSKFNGKRLKEKLQEKAKQKLEGSMRIQSENEKEFNNFVNSAKQKGRTGKYALEVEKIFKKIKALGNPADQTILTEKMIQAILNDFYEMEFYIQRKRKELEDASGMFPNEDCINYDFYPTCFNFRFDPSIEDYINASDEIEVDIEDFDCIANMSIEDFEEQ